MEVKIGVQHAARELVIETDESAESIQQLIDGALRDGGLLSLDDSKGKRTVVPADKIAYVEIGRGVAGQVGFRS